MRSQRRLAIFGIALALSAGAALVVEHGLKGLLVRIVAARTGRQLRIEGPFEVQLFSLHPHLEAQNVSISNPPWMPTGVMADIGTISVGLRWQLSLPPFAVRRLEINGARLHLMRQASGHANWYLQKTGPGKGPPLINSLSMPDAHVDLRDERHHLEFHGRVSAGDIEDGTPEPPLRIAAAGELNGRAVSFAVTGEPLAHVRLEQPYHFTLVEQSGGDHLEGRGFLEKPFDFRRLQARFTLSGPDLQDLYYLIGLKMPNTGAYRASGKLLRNYMRFEYHDLSVTSGQSDLGGQLSVDASTGRPKIEGELTARTLRLADLGERAAGGATQQERTAELPVPTTPLPSSGLQRSDGHVKLEALRLELGPTNLEQLTATLSIDHGVLTLAKLRSSLAGGVVAGSARLDTTRGEPRVELSLSAAEIRLEQLTRGEGRAPPISGMLSGRVELAGQGESIHDMLGTANGTVSAVIPGGEMRAALADAATLDLAGALGMIGHSDKKTHVRCGVARLDVQDGALSARTLVLDTDEALISGRGEMHLDSGTLDLSVHASPKHLRATLHSDLSIRGTLSHPEIRPSTGKVLAQGAAAAALGVALTPVAAVLAFINPKLAHDADCATLTAQTAAPQQTGELSEH